VCRFGIAQHGCGSCVETGQPDAHGAMQLADLVGADLREADVGDLSLGLKFGESAHLVQERNGGVVAVEVAQMELFEAKAAQAGFRSGS
jgi:hypothetical protein